MPFKTLRLRKIRRKNRLWSCDSDNPDNSDRSDGRGLESDCLPHLSLDRSLCVRDSVGHTIYHTMVQFFDEISPSLGKWIDQQQVFWVATAPLSGDGHVNVSPKGGEGAYSRWIYKRDQLNVDPARDVPYCKSSSGVVRGPYGQRLVHSVHRWTFR